MSCRRSCRLSARLCAVLRVACACRLREIGSGGRKSGSAAQNRPACALRSIPIGRRRDRRPGDHARLDPLDPSTNMTGTDPITDDTTGPERRKAALRHARKLATAALFLDTAPNLELEAMTDADLLRLREPHGRGWARAGPSWCGGTSWRHGCAPRSRSAYAPGARRLYPRCARQIRRGATGPGQARTRRARWCWRTRVDRWLDECLDAAGPAVEDGAVDDVDLQERAPHADLNVVAGDGFADPVELAHARGRRHVRAPASTERLVEGRDGAEGCARGGRRWTGNGAA